jgi:hypothetical protein
LDVSSFADYQHGTHRQHAPGHEVIQPGPHPQAPVVPLHAANLTIGVAFLSAWRLAAPCRWVCALAWMAIVPSTNAVAVKIIVSFRI